MRKNRVRFFFFFFFFSYRERVEFSNIFFQVSKWGKLGQNAVNTHIYTSAFLSHWIQILANSSPKSDIFKKKKKKKRPCFFAFYGRSGEGNIKKNCGGGLRSRQCHVHVHVHVCPIKCITIGLRSVCIATVFVPKVESGERADVPKVELGKQRVKHGGH